MSKNSYFTYIIIISTCLYFTEADLNGHNHLNEGHLKVTLRSNDNHFGLFVFMINIVHPEQLSSRTSFQLKEEVLDTTNG